MRADQATLAEQKRKAENVRTWLQLGRQHLQAGRHAMAKAQFEQILEVVPNHLEALNYLGNLLLNLGQYDKALEVFQRAGEIAPNSAPFQVAIGNAHQALGQASKSIESYKAAVRLQPDYAEAHHNLGSAMFQLGAYAEAVVSYHRATEIAPNYVEAHANLGHVYQQMHAYAQAEAQYKRALVLAPAHPSASRGLAYLLKEGNPEVAITLLQKVVLNQRVDAALLVTYAKLLHQQGKTEEAREYLKQSIAATSNTGLKAYCAFSLPIIMGTSEQVRESRVQFEQNLNQLVKEGIQIADPVAQQCETNFYLAFQGFNDRDLQVQIAKFYSKACPSLLYVAPHCLTTQSASKIKRIGFYSKYIARHSVSVSYSRMIEQLAKHEDFEVTLISTGDSQSTSIRDTYPDFAGAFVPLETVDLHSARQKIAALELDVLVYLDIGMEPFGYFLGYSRLATVQCVLGGHPDTTGLPNMDYFISNDLAEPENAQEHYSEKLIRQQSGAYYFGKVPLPSEFKTRKQLGLPEHKHVYACPMMLFKLHPDFDEACAQILQQDPNGEIVLFEDKNYSYWRSLLQARFAKTMPVEVRSRVIFMPWVTDKMDFISVLHHSDVILDPFHFGLGTTAIPIYSVGTPCVTKPGEFARGRYGYYFSRKMDVMECVAYSTEEYAAKAVKLASDPEYRAAVKKKIMTNNVAIFDRADGIGELVALLQSF